MGPIRDTEEYQRIRRSARELVDTSLVTNCFLLPGQVRLACSEGRLSHVDVPGEAALLFMRHESHYQVYLFARKGAQLAGAFPRLDAPAVVENPFSARTLDEPLPEGAQAIRDAVETAGFVLGRSSHMMAREATPARVGVQGASGTVQLGGRGFCFESATQADAPALQELLADNFDPLFSYLPSGDGLARGIERGDFLVCRDARGACVALLQHEEARTTSTIRHLAVRADCRGLGMASLLVDRYLAASSDEVRRFELWVDDANLIAQRTYTGSGYCYHSKRCESYVLA